jgi:hypothetical protein
MAALRRLRSEPPKRCTLPGKDGCLHTLAGLIEYTRVCLRARTTCAQCVALTVHGRAHQPCAHTRHCVVFRCLRVVSICFSATLSGGPPRTPPPPPPSPPPTPPPPPPPPTQPHLTTDHHHNNNNQNHHSSHTTATRWVYVTGTSALDIGGLNAFDCLGNYVAPANAYITGGENASRCINNASVGCFSPAGNASFPVVLELDLGTFAPISRVDVYGINNATGYTIGLYVGANGASPIVRVHTHERSRARAHTHTHTRTCMCQAYARAYTHTHTHNNAHCHNLTHVYSC